LAVGVWLLKEAGGRERIETARATQSGGGMNA
jgi:hypothetical protein